MNEELMKLESEIKKYDEVYFLKNESLISDSEYDKLVKRYEELGGDKKVILSDINASKLNLTKHSTKMLSLAKVNTHLEFDKWIEKISNKYPEVKFIYEYKLDGLALSIKYEDGKLVSIRTRGDGITAEEVTHNSFLLKWVPNEINYKGDLEVRGEAFIVNEILRIINEILYRNYKSSRNAVSGIIRTLKELDRGLEGLIYFNCYGAIGEVLNDFKTYTETLNYLHDLGFSTPPKAVIEDIYENNRSTLKRKELLDKGIPEFPVDGIVVKVDEINIQKELGENNKHPNWAIAYKFPNNTTKTTLEGIEWYLGRTGVLTPCAFYKPFELDGRTFKYASLSNYRNFANLGLYKDAEIYVDIANDIIPQVVGLVTNDKVINEEDKFPIPKFCPSCNHPLIFDGANNEDIFLRCPNTLGCESQLIRKFINYVGKGGVDVKGFGKVIVYRLVEGKVLKQLSNVYTLTVEDCLKRNIGEKVAIKLINEIKYQIENGTNAYKVLAGFGIEDVGLTKAKEICNGLKDSDELLELLLSFHRLKEIDGIGDATAMTIVSTMNNEIYYNELKSLLELSNPIFENNNKEDLIPICITGSYGLSRNELKDIFLNKGYDVVNNVSKNVVYLLTGTRPSTTKVSKAIELGIPVIEIPVILEEVFKLI